MDNEKENQEDYLQLRRNISEEAPWKQMQKKTFTRWANEHLKQAGEQIVNLERDLSDGLLLTTLVEVLSKKELGTKEMRRHKKLDTVTKALKFLEQNEKIRLVSIDSVAIVDGKLKLILGLLWKLIQHYSICMPTDTDQTSEKNVRAWLLEWINNKLKNYKVGNFKADWRDGRALGALVDAVAPGLCPEWEDWNAEDTEENIRVAIETADQWLGVAQLINPEDLLSSQLDELSMITYLSQFQHAALKTGAPLRARVRAFGPGLLSGKVYVDDPTNFTVETFTAGTLDISVLDAESNCVERSTIVCKDEKQTYVCNYFPQVDGEFQVILKFNDQPLVKSPFRVMVKRGTNKEKMLQRKVDALESKLLQEQRNYGELEKLYDKQVLDQKQKNEQCFTELTIAKEMQIKVEEEMKSLKQQLLVEKGRCDRYKEQEQALMDQSQELAEKYHQQENEIKILRDQVMELMLYQSKSADLELELTRLNKQSCELNDEALEYKEETKSLREKILKHEQESTKQNEEINSLVTELVDEQTKCTELEDEIRCLHDTLAYEKEQFKRLEADTAFLRDQWTQCQTKAAQADMEINNLKDVLLEGQDISSQYLVEISCLKEQLMETKAIAHEYKAFNESLKKQLQNEQTKFASGYIENKRLIAQLTENVSEMKQLKTMMIAVQNKLTTYKQDLKRQVSETQIISKQLKDEIEQLKRISFQVQENSDALEYELVYKSNQVLELMEEATLNEKQLKIIETQLTNERTACCNLEERIKSLSAMLKDETCTVKAAYEQINHFKDLYQQSEMENKVLNNQLMASRRRTQELETENSSLKEHEMNNNTLEGKQNDNEKEFERTTNRPLHLESQSQWNEDEIKVLNENTVIDLEKQILFKNEINVLKQQTFEEKETSIHYKELCEEDEQFKRCGKVEGIKGFSGSTDEIDSSNLTLRKRILLNKVTRAMLSSTNDRLTAKRISFGLFGTISAAVMLSLGYKFCGQLSYINCIYMSPVWLLDNSDLGFSK